MKSIIKISLMMLILISCSKDTMHHKKPKKIFFIMTKGHLGGSKGFLGLWNEMKQAGHNMKIVAIPEYIGGNKVHDIDHEFLKLFEPNDIIIPCKQEKCESIEKYKPDYTFIFNPYAEENAKSPTAAYNHVNLSKISKVMYMVYYPGLFHQSGLYDTNLSKTIDTIFVDSLSTKQIYVKEYNFYPSKVIVSGYEAYHEIRDIKPNINTNQTILWMPRWYLSFSGRDGFESGSTFLNYYHFFYNFAKDNKDIKLIFRPHENMMKYAVSGKFLSQQDVDIILNNFKKLPNVIISNHSSTPLINDIINSDIIIADGTTAIAEAIIANKPIIYTSNGLNLEFGGNEISKKVKELVYFAYSPSNILSFIDILQKDNMQMFGREICKNNNIPIAYLKYHKSDIDEVCKNGYQKELLELKQMMDPVENPARFIANYLLYLN